MRVETKIGAAWSSFRCLAPHREGEGPWVLVVDGGSGQSRSALAATRALGLAGYRVAVGAATRLDLASCSRFCSEVLPIPPVTSSGFADAVRCHLDRFPEASLVVTSDAALVALNRPERRFVDKVWLEQQCALIPGLEMPPSTLCTEFSSLEAIVGSFGSPVVLKPVVSVHPARVVADPADLPTHLDEPVIVQPFVDGPLESVSGVVNGGELLAVVHQLALRTWPMNCGTSCAAITVERNEHREEMLLQLLADHSGLFQAQFLGRYLIDVNPRPYGSLPLALAAGVNLVALSVDPSPSGSDPIVAKPGVRYRWIEGDLRHGLSLLGRSTPLDALDSFRPRSGTTHSVAAWSDLKPVLTRLRFAASRR